MSRAEDMLRAFALPEGELVAMPFGNGHINDTFLVKIAGADEDYVLQRINGYVFPHPEEVMENIQRVTAYLSNIIQQEGGDPRRETIQLIPTREGATFVRDETGDVWRVMLRVPDSVSPENPDSPEILEDCGRAFGLFSRRLLNYPSESLHETIQGFHDTPHRYRQLMDAAAEDTQGRLAEVGAEMDFARARERDTHLLLDALRAGTLPLRVTHNDTKVNNVLLDARTMKAICVVDLDTVMPGLMAYDFGDGVRVGACTAAEDETDLSRVSLDLEKYAAFARGFLAPLRPVLSQAEILSLADGARLMTLENGLRFLADHLNGDVYFKIHRPGHNLDRARAQFALVADMEKKREQMRDILMA